MGIKGRPFSLLIIGDYDEEQLKKYDKNEKVEPYLKYKFDDMDKLFNDKLLIYNAILNSNDVAFTVDLKKRLYQYISSLNDYENPAFEYYKEITVLSGLKLDENGDAFSTENPNGKFIKLDVGLKTIGMPFYKNGDKENNLVYSELTKGEIDWGKIHKNKKDVAYYTRLWEIFVEQQEPTEEELPLVNSMQFMPGIIGKFRDKGKDYYISFYTSWGCNAVLKDGEWYEMNELEDEFIWFNKFYDTFIKVLDDNTKLTLCECYI